MAAKKGKGMLSEPPTKKSKKGRTPGVRRVNEKYKDMNKTENKLINERARQDIYLADAARRQLPRAYKNFEQDIDYSKLPSAPVTGDFNAWRQQQIDTGAEDFNRRFSDQFAQEDQDFQTEMYSRGIPLGSDLYNRLQKQSEMRQNDAKLANLRAAQESAGQNAASFFSTGTQARNNALQEQMQRRNQPLADYAQLSALQSGMGAQAYGNQFGYQTQENSAEAGMALQGANNAAAMARLQAGQDPNNYQGTGMTYQQVLAAQNEAARQAANDADARAKNNNPKPNYWGQLASGAAGGLAQGVGYGLFR